MKKTLILKAQQDSGEDVDIILDGQDAKIQLRVSNGDDVISTGTKGWMCVPFTFTITGWTITSDVSGSIVFDIWKDTYANFPPTVADTITASAKPTLSSALTATSTTLTGWTVTINKGDYIKFNVDSATTVKEVLLEINITKKK